MQINQATLPLLAVLQGFGLNHHVRGWNRILRRLFPHDAQASRHIATTRWGLPYLADPANYIDWNVLCFGAYERDDLELFRRLGGNGATCLDIGANVGHHTIFFASLGWTMHAFEPNPQLWGEFESKITAGGRLPVTLHKIGLGLEDTELQFELENNTNSGTGRFTCEDLQPPTGGSKIGLLPIRNGDRYLAEAGIGRVDVIKMDVQGFEPETLAGLRETLLRDRPLVAIEISADNVAKFGSFEQFKQYFPGGYSFLRNRLRNYGLLSKFMKEDYYGEDFLSMNGNIFCIPKKQTAT